MKKLDLNFLETFIYSSTKAKEEKKKIVLIHGFYTDHRCFELFYSKMRNHYECICFNLPGCGTLKYYPLSYLQLENIAKLIAKYIIENDLNDLYLIGHSLGASISAMVVNILKNKHVCKVCLVAPFNITSIPKVITKPFKFNNLNNEKSYNELQKMIFADYDKAIAKFSEQRYYDGLFDFHKRNHKYSIFIMLNMVQIWTLSYLNSSYKAIKIPTQLILAGKDQFVSLDKTIQYFSKFNNNLQITQYLNSGHAIFIEEFERFFEEILHWIEDDLVLNKNGDDKKDLEFGHELFFMEDGIENQHTTEIVQNYFENEAKNQSNDLMFFSDFQISKMDDEENDYYNVDTFDVEYISIDEFDKMENFEKK